MRHKKKNKKIGKDLKHKKAILKNLALSFLNRERIKTTLTKGKLFRSFIEKIINKAKKDTLHNRRIVYKKIKNTYLLKKLFVNIAKRYGNRSGGYTRLYKVGRRKGDDSELCLVELVPELIDEKNEDQVVKEIDKKNKRNKEIKNNKELKERVPLGIEEKKS